MFIDKTHSYTKRLPNLICPGAQKAGTTTLFFLLKQHPDISGANYKEIQFFDKYYHKGIDWYQEKCRKSSDSKYIMDFTPGYMTEDIYIKRMKETFNDNVKVIVVLRNPVDRMYSNYLMNCRIGLENESDAMKAFDIDYKGFQSNNKTTNYYRHSLYSEKVNLLIEAFPKNNLKIVLFEDMVRNTEHILNEIWEFLDISIPEQMNYNEWHNNSGSSQVPWLMRTVRKIIGHRQEAIRKIFPYKLIKIYKKIFSSASKKSKVKTVIKKDLKVCRVLMGRCLADIKILEEILGIKLDVWIDKYKSNNV